MTRPWHAAVEEALRGKASPDAVAQAVQEVGGRPGVTSLQVYNLVGRLVAAEPHEWDALFDEPWTEGWSSRLFQLERASVYPARPDVGFKRGGDGIECQRCHRRETFYYQLQTRSGDEGMTTFYSCGHCYARWKG